ncbi:MAG: ThiF family adenylyltransferase [Candidatus Izemoplasma sp.]|nr:ThiF family adenylyltransferase [Candidatus Izemoplasma sp.]
MIHARTQRQFGEETYQKLINHTIMIVGLGGVGGYVAESLARFGIKHLILVDHDTVEASNINRQIVALHSTIGNLKVDVLKKRITDINPEIEITVYPVFYNADTKTKLFEHKIDFIVDAIDTITYKIDLAKECLNRDIGHIAVMGTGDKLGPENLNIMPLYKTQTDPIARVMRRKLKTHPGYKTLQTVCSFEQPSAINKEGRTPTSNAFVPASAGLMASSYVTRYLLEKIKR